MIRRRREKVTSDIRNIAKPNNLTILFHVSFSGLKKCLEMFGFDQTVFQKHVLEQGSKLAVVSRILQLQILF